MGYEIAGGLGVKMADPSREVIVMLGDGSYLMMNSEIATSVMLGLKLTIVVLDNRGFGCINRLQNATGGASFNNLLQQMPATRPCRRSISPPMPRAWARSPRRWPRLAELESALAQREGQPAHHGRRHRHRPARLDRCRRRTGGTSRCRR